MRPCLGLLLAGMLTEGVLKRSELPLAFPVSREFPVSVKP